MVWVNITMIFEGFKDQKYLKIGILPSWILFSSFWLQWNPKHKKWFLYTYKWTFPCFYEVCFRVCQLPFSGLFIFIVMERMSQTLEEKSLTKEWQVAFHLIKWNVWSFQFSLILLLLSARGWPDGSCSWIWQSVTDWQLVGDLEVTILALGMRSWVTGVLMPVYMSIEHREVSMCKLFLLFKSPNTVFSW